MSRCDTGMAIRGPQMAIDIQQEAPPLRRGVSDAVYVGNTRVLLERVIHAFQEGATPEDIVQRYPTTCLADVYASITYYLRHREAIEQYLEERERIARSVRQRIEAHQGDLSGIRDRLLSGKTA